MHGTYMVMIATDSQCLHTSCLHDYLSSTGVSPPVEPAVSIHTSCGTLQSRQVDVLLDVLEEREKASDPHCSCREIPAKPIEL